MSAMHYLIRRFMTLSLLAALPGACTEKGEETTTGSATDTSGDSTGAPTSDPTTGASDDSTGTTGDDSSVTGEQTSGESTTGDPTTGDPGALCVAYTEWVYGCGLGEPGGKEEAIDECELQREQTAAIDGPECAARADAYIECISKSACDDPAPCAAEFEAIDVCGPEPGATCLKFAETVEACEPGEGEEELASGCQYELNAATYASADCGAAMEALYACYGDLTCEEIMEGPTTCAQQEMMTETACPGENGVAVQSK
jgi:hypothetical protein